MVTSHTIHLATPTEVVSLPNRPQRLQFDAELLRLRVVGIRLMLEDDLAKAVGAVNYPAFADLPGLVFDLCDKDGNYLARFLPGRKLGKPSVLPGDARRGRDQWFHVDWTRMDLGNCYVINNAHKLMVLQFQLLIQP